MFLNYKCGNCLDFQQGNNTRILTEGDCIGLCVMAFNDKIALTFIKKKSETDQKTEKNKSKQKYCIVLTLHLYTQ